MRNLNIALLVTAVVMTAVFVSGCGRQDSEPELKTLYEDETVIIYSVQFPGAYGNPSTHGFIIKTKHAIHDEEHYYGKRKNIPGIADRP